MGFARSNPSYEDASDAADTYNLQRLRGEAELGLTFSLFLRE
jgi:hypothetical protein